MSANEGGKLLAVWVVARRVAAPLIPLLLGAAAMALLLDSGTVHLPPIRSGSTSPKSAPAEKIVVSAPAPVHPTGHKTTRAKAHTQTSAASGSTAGGTAASSTSSVSSSPSGTGGGHASNPKAPPTGSTPAPPKAVKPVQPPAPPAAAPKATPPTSRKSEKGPKHLTPPGHSADHRRGPPSGHVPPGQAKKADQPLPHHSQGDERHGHGHGHGHANGHSHGQGQDDGDGHGQGNGHDNGHSNGQGQDGQGQDDGEGHGSHGRGHDD